jgi:hypothetical protein
VHRLERRQAVVGQEELDGVRRIVVAQGFADRVHQLVRGRGAKRPLGCHESVHDVGYAILVTVTAFDPQFADAVRRSFLSVSSVLYVLPEPVG